MEEAPGPSAEPALPREAWVVLLPSRPPLAALQTPSQRGAGSPGGGVSGGRGGSELERGRSLWASPGSPPWTWGKPWDKARGSTGQVARPTPASQTCRRRIMSSSFWQQQLRTVDLESRSGPWSQVIISLERKPSGS